MNNNKTTATTAHRALHLVDVENQVCGRVTPASCRAFYAAYNALGVIRPMDHVIVGVAPENLVDTFPLPSGWRRVVGPSGEQSADLAIKNEEPAPSALTTYDELILASSDGGFLDLVLRAKSAGLRVTLVSNVHRLPHWQMYVAANRHLTLNLPSTMPLAAA